MTNKPMLSVQRELLENHMRLLACAGLMFTNVEGLLKSIDELRAFLDKPVVESQYDGMTQDQAQAVSDGIYEILHGKTAQPYQRCTTLKECNVKSSPATGARVNAIAKPVTRRVCHGCVGLKREVFCCICDEDQPALVAVVMPEFESAFEAWWESDGQYCRAGGGSYEKTFAYHSYEAALAEVARLNWVKP